MSYSVIRPCSISCRIKLAFVMLCKFSVWSCMVMTLCLSKEVSESIDFVLHVDSLGCGSIACVAMVCSFGCWFLHCGRLHLQGPGRWQRPQEVSSMVIFVPVSNLRVVISLKLCVVFVAKGSILHDGLQSCCIPPVGFF